MGSLIIFAVFVSTIAFLNVTAVPDAGRAGEEKHRSLTMDALNALQADAEAAAAPGVTGRTVAGTLSMAPEPHAGDGFFSFFLATPARSAGTISMDASYGNLTLTHVASGVTVADLGNTSQRFPYGRVAFDPRPIFTDGVGISLETGAVVTTAGGASTMRFEPPVKVTVNGTLTEVSVLGRVLNGTTVDMGGTGLARIRLTTEASTLERPSAPNAERATLRLETSAGPAWGGFLNATSQAAGLSASSGHYATTVQRGAGPTGLDVVTWTVEGRGSGHDVILTSGLTIYTVAVSG